MFLTGTLLNVAAVLVGTTVGLLIGSRMPRRFQEILTDGLGLFTLLRAMRGGSGPGKGSEPTRAP